MQKLVPTHSAGFRAGFKALDFAVSWPNTRRGIRTIPHFPSLRPLFERASASCKASFFFARCQCLRYTPKPIMDAAAPKKLSYDVFASPIGPLFLLCCDEGLRVLNWYDGQPLPQHLGEDIVEQNPSHTILADTRLQLREYFEGRRRSFDIPLSLQGTPFQKSAWEALCAIPFGKTISYQAQAQKLGGPSKCRAVGGANGKNPVSIIVPCHRVIAKDGGLGGYGGGLAKKRFLLSLEGALSPQQWLQEKLF